LMETCGPAGTPPRWAVRADRSASPSATAAASAAARFAASASARARNRSRCQCSAARIRSAGGRGFGGGCQASWSERQRLAYSRMSSDSGVDELGIGEKDATGRHEGLPRAWHDSVRWPGSARRSKARRLQRKSQACVTTHRTQHTLFGSRNFLLLVLLTVPRILHTHRQVGRSSY
jgi:hypothetical protein